jgi:hypothetical protein
VKNRSTGRQEREKRAADATPCALASILTSLYYDRPDNQNAKYRADDCFADFGTEGEATWRQGELYASSAATLCQLRQFTIHLKDIFSFGEVLEQGIPSLRCSDGPNGTRGRRFFNGTPASCFPCGTGLAASFDVDLVKRVGEAIGDEARAKSAHIILGPVSTA